MASNNKTLPIAVFFSRLFRGFPRLLLTNLIFAVPLGAFFGLFYLINELTGLHSNLFVLLTVIPVFPFYAGVVQVTAQMSQSDDKFPVFSTFVSAVRDNFLPFLLHGVVLYLAVFFSYWSISLYAQLGKVQPMFYTLMVVSAIIGLFFLFLFFYLPAMTVTFDIKLRSVYKNSFLMTFGELKYNLLAFFGLFLLSAVCATFLIAAGGSRIAIIIVTAVLAFAVVPAVAAFIIHSAVYRRMYLMVVDNASQSAAVDGKVSQKQKKLQELKKKEQQKELDEELKKFDLDAEGDDNEYVYFNGRMVKRGVIRRLQQEAGESEES